jgi:molecular chaperone DnaK
MALQRLREEAEKTKIALSSATSYDVNLPFITADASGPKHLNMSISRSKMEQICEKLFERMDAPYKNCLKDAGVSNSELNELVLVGGMTRMPKVVDYAKKFGGKVPNQGVNPDEVVAVGAAVQGGVLKGEVSDVLLLDVTPLTLAIETAGNIATPMIPRNTTIPAKKSQVFSTYSDNQPSVDIVVLQGERPMSKDNKRLGNFKLDGIPPAPRGTPQIEVTFDIDANGILHVSAKDLGTGKAQDITIQGSSGLSKEEVERMKQEAEANADKDKELKENLETKNSLDNIIYGWEKQLKDGNLEDSVKTEVQKGIDKGKEVLQSGDVSKMKDVISELSKLGELVYKNKSAGNKGTPDDPIEPEIVS